MKFITKKQIPGFNQKSKPEQKRLIKLAGQDKNNLKVLVILMVILIFGVTPLIEKLVLHFLGEKSFWIELLATIPVLLVMGVIGRGFMLYPKIAQIINKEEQNSEQNCSTVPEGAASQPASVR